MYWYTWDFLVSITNYNDLSKPSFPSKRPLLGLRDVTSLRWYIWDFLILGVNCDDRSKPFSPSKRSLNLPLNLGALCNLLSIGSNQSWDSSSELSIRLSRVFFYLLEITRISMFFSIPPNRLLDNLFSENCNNLILTREGNFGLGFSKTGIHPYKIVT